MAVFSYKAIDAQRAVLAGTIAADTPKQARDRLRSRGLTVHTFDELTKPKNPGAWRLRRQRKKHETQVLSFCREMATLLGVGVSMLDAVDTVLKQAKGSFRSTLLQLRERIASGGSLAEAMGDQPGVFDELAVRIIEVGEETGRLDTVLDEFVAFREKSVRLKNHLGAALLYPMIVSATGLGVAIFLMTFVVPQLLEGLIEAGRPLPKVTVAVKAASDLLIHRWWLMLALLAGLFVLQAVVLATPRGRYAWHALLLKLPGVGALIRKQAVVRISIVLASLLRSGLPFLQALAVTRRATPNLALRRALERFEHDVSIGRDLGQALDQAKAFPPVVVRVFAVGQQSGRLEGMLERLAHDYDGQVAAATNKLTALLEPLLIILLAVVIGVIALATILPILEAGHVV